VILVDTSIWADHFRAADPAMVRLLAARGVVAHRLVIEELVLGHLPRRGKTLAMLGRLPRLEMVEREEIIRFVDANGLIGAGIGLIDVHLLASSLKAGAALWTRDKRLAAQAQRLGCAWTG
jgi:hypothetical protein